MTDKLPPPIPETLTPYLLSDRNALRYRNQLVELLKNDYTYLQLKIGEWSFEVTFNRADIEKIQALVIATLDKGMQIARQMEHDHEEEYKSGQGPNAGYG